MYLFIILLIYSGIVNCFDQKNTAAHCKLLQELFEQDSFSLQDIEKIQASKKSLSPAQLAEKVDPCDISLPLLIKFSEYIIKESQKNTRAMKIGKVGAITTRESIYEDKLNALIESVVYDKSYIEDLQKSYKLRLK